MNLKKGFTLIELLVVVAIIGILASVVLASLTSARSKGKDAAVFAQLSNMRAQAELYYSSNGNYGGGTTAYTAATGLVATGVSILPAAATCGTAVAGDGAATVGASIFGQPASASGLFGLISGACTSGAQAMKGQVDAAIATAWAVTAQGASSNAFYCVDSAGDSKSYTTAQTLGALGTAICP